MERGKNILIEVPVGELAGMKALQPQEEEKEVLPLLELSLRDFRRGLTELLNKGGKGLLEDVRFLPMPWFHPTLSCCVQKEKKITALLLSRLVSEERIVPVLFFALEPDASGSLLKMLRYFVQEVQQRMTEDSVVMIFRSNPSMKALCKKLFPDKRGEEVLIAELRMDSA